MDGFYAARASTNDGASLDGFVTALHTIVSVIVGALVISWMVRRNTAI